MAGRMAADQSTKRFEAMGLQVTDTKQAGSYIQSSAVALARQWFALGNSSSFVSQILNSTMLVTPTVVHRQGLFHHYALCRFDHTQSQDDQKFN